MIYSVMLVSGVQQSDCYIYHIDTFFRFFFILGFHRILNIVPLLVIYVIYIYIVVYIY